MENENSYRPKEENEPSSIVLLEIYFEKFDAVRAVSQKSQEYLLDDLYRAGHDSGPCPGLYLFLNIRIRKLKKHLELDKDGYKQTVVTAEKPVENVDKEELWLLDRYLGALIALSQEYLSQSNLPDEIKTQFAKAEAITEMELDNINRNVTQWYKDHPEKNTRIEPDTIMVKLISMTYQRMEDLVEFYRTKRIVPNLHEIEDKSGRGGIDLKSNPDAIPIFILMNFYSLFSPSNRNFKQYADSVGWDVGPIDDEE